MLNKIKNDFKTWYFADGWLPLKDEKKNSGLEGHEAIIILNCNKKDAKLLMDIYFENREPKENIKLVVPARRVKCFRMDHPDEIGGLEIGRLVQHALRFRSNEPVIIQYGRMDITQPNLAYIGIMGVSD